MDLLKQQDQLQKEGQEVLEKLKLLGLLGKYGKVELVGSIETGLMSWQDIDMDVLADLSKDEFFEVSKQILYLTNVRQLQIIDNVYSKDPRLPNIKYIGIKYREDGGQQWNIDVCFFSSQSERRAPEFDSWLKSKLTEDSRKIILTLKNEISKNPKYGKSLFSADIYKAVLNEGIKDLDEFKKYLEKNGKILN